MAAHHRFLASRYRPWTNAITQASAKKPGPKPAALAAKLLGDTPATQLRHAVAELHEEIEVDGETGLSLALQAAACSPSWDPTFVAWSIRGVAFWLRRLGRLDEARSVIARLWKVSPLYVVGRAEAHALGVKPPALACPTGPADHLRLAGMQVLLGAFRPTHMRHITMAVSLLWTKDFAAAARMASLAGKGTKYEGTWAQELEAFAAKEAKRAPGAIQPVPQAVWGKRTTAVKEAIAHGDLPALRGLALDPSQHVMLDAWIGLAKLGEGEVVRGLLEEMIAASKTGSTRTEQCYDLEFALSEMPKKPSTPGVGKKSSARKSGVDARTGVGLAELTLAKVKAGAACSVPIEKTKLSLKGVPPSLAAWIAGGGGLNVTKAEPLGTLARQAHGNQFSKLPAALSKSRALALCEPELVGDTLEVLALDFADEHGEAPVLALDVSDGPATWVTTSSFGEWIANDVGVGAPGDTREATERVFGGEPPRL